MKPKPQPSDAATSLRRGAEERLREQHREAIPPENPADTQRLLHELQVHQIELEMQNEELRQARDAVEAGLEKYSDLYDFAPVGYLTLDREGRVLEANLTAAQMVGFERSRLLKRRLGEQMAPTDQVTFRSFLTNVFTSKSKVSCEVTLIAEAKHPVEVRIEAVLAATGRECRAAVTDITERKRADRDRLMLCKLESTGILAAGIAHDFNNLLTVILLNLELAKAQIAPQGELAHLLEQAEQAAMSSRDLTQRLLAFASGEPPVRQPTRLPELIRASVGSALSGSSTRCDFSLAENLWPAVVDSPQIGQVIRNLVLNAREAMSDGGIIAVRAENLVLSSQGHPSLPPGDYVSLSITDQGAGMAKEVLSKIFDPYFSTKQRGNQKGMGLGLTICHTVLQRHGGIMTVQSMVGVGTTFDLFLPAQREMSRPSDAPVAASSHAERIPVQTISSSLRSPRDGLQTHPHPIPLPSDGRGCPGGG